MSWAAAGGVDTTGTPANNQIATFTDADTLEGLAGLTYDNSGGGYLTLLNSGSGNSTNLKVESSATSGATPSRLILRTAAGNTADTYMSFHSVDTYEYSIGVDNSDSDIFKISGSAPGTNDKLEIKSDGTVGIHNKLGVGLVDPSTRFHMKGSGAEIATVPLAIFDPLRAVKYPPSRIIICKTSKTF